MRIIGGKFSGRIITAPNNLPVRPTTDYAKSGIFNILIHRIDFEALTVLDLFAGIGGMSVEFISRGAKQVTAVDINEKCSAFIKDIAIKFGISNLRVVRSDVFRFLKNCDSTFDLIFADAPFEMKDSDRLPEMVSEKKLLNENGLLIIEHHSKRTINSKFIPAEVRAYGNCAFSIFTAESLI